MYPSRRAPVSQVATAPQRNQTSARGTTYLLMPAPARAALVGRGGGQGRDLDEVEVVEQADPGDAGQHVQPHDEARGSWGLGPM